MKAWPTIAACLAALSPVALAAQPVVPEAAEAPDKPLAPIDPEQLAAAQSVVAQIFPDGTYARIMNSSFERMMNSIVGKTEDLPIRQMAAAAGLPSQDVANLGTGTIKQLMAIMDPAFAQRQAIVMHTMTGEMTGMMIEIEPEIRDGLAQAYAREYTRAQLDELYRFFETPTGKLYARDSMVMFMRPEVMAKMQAAVPAMMQKMPTIVAKIQEATASLPKPKTYAQLTPEDRRRLAEILGTPAPQGAGKKRN